MFRTHANAIAGAGAKWHIRIPVAHASQRMPCQALALWHCGTQPLEPALRQELVWLLPASSVAVHDERADQDRGACRCNQWALSFDQQYLNCSTCMMLPKARSNPSPTSRECWTVERHAQSDTLQDVEAAERHWLRCAAAHDVRRRPQPHGLQHHRLQTPQRPARRTQEALIT